MILILTYFYNNIDKHIIFINLLRLGNIKILINFANFHIILFVTHSLGHFFHPHLLNGTYGHKDLIQFFYQLLLLHFLILIK